MQSTASAIAAAAIGGADLTTRASSPRGSDSSNTVGGDSSLEFDGNQAETWINARWKAVESSVSDNSLPETERAQVYESAPGLGGGGAWGPNKKTTNTQFANDLSKAAAAAGLS